MTTLPKPAQWLCWSRNCLTLWNRVHKGLSLDPVLSRSFTLYFLIYNLIQLSHLSLISRSGDIPTIHTGVFACISHIPLCVACPIPVRRLELKILMVYRTALFWDNAQRAVEIPYRDAANNVIPHRNARCSGNSLPGRSV